MRQWQQEQKLRQQIQERWLARGHPLGSAFTRNVSFKVQMTMDFTSKACLPVVTMWLADTARSGGDSVDGGSCSSVGCNGGLWDARGAVPVM